MTIKDFIAKHNISVSLKTTYENPNMENSGDMFNYSATLKMGRKRFTLPFSTGKGWTRAPDASDILECLQSDYYVKDMDFEDFCSEFGYDLDSRKAEKTWRACGNQSVKLDKFLGDLIEEFRACEDI